MGTTGASKCEPSQSFLKVLVSYPTPYRNVPGLYSRTLGPFLTSLSVHNSPLFLGEGLEQFEDFSYFSAILDLNVITFLGFSRVVLFVKGPKPLVLKKRNSLPHMIGHTWNSSSRKVERQDDPEYKATLACSELCLKKQKKSQNLI